jgi:hypothetical protein
LHVRRLEITQLPRNAFRLIFFDGTGYMYNSSEASAPHRLAADAMVSTQTSESDPAALQTPSTDNPPDPVASSSRTLLPGPVAALVSTVTGVSSLSIKVGTRVGGLWIAGAREATLTGLELTRAAVEAVLTTAGRDVSQRRNGELGRAEAASILEKSVRFPMPRSRVKSCLLSQSRCRSPRFIPQLPLCPFSRPQVSTCLPPAWTLPHPYPFKACRP